MYIQTRSFLLCDLKQSLLFAHVTLVTLVITMSDHRRSKESLGNATQEPQMCTSMYSYAHFRISIGSDLDPI